MLIHQIQGPEDAVMRAPITPAQPADLSESPERADQSPNVAPRTAIPSAWLFRTRRAISALRSFIDSMTDPDSKFCEA
jgi:hypothetical protein